jgi:rhamnose transport system ATP-binding protein
MLNASTASRVPEAAAEVRRPVLTLAGICKSFPSVRALSGVALDLYPGEVTALIGENGAGKSTLVKILTGIYQPDEGAITLGGEPVAFASARQADLAGITAIHQETVLFDELSVAENIFLGHAPRGRFGLIDWGAMNAAAASLLDRIGARIAPQTRLKDLGIASRHLVAIARALSVEARIVIMDEPTAALSHKEIAELYGFIERLKAEGKAILFISHKFDEIFRIADRYVVFRDGEQVGAGLISQTDHDTLVRLMVGRSVDQIFAKQSVAIGDTVLEVSGYSHPTEFADIGFALRRGEILGFYGLIGAGRSELMQALFGLTPPSRGGVRIGGESAVIRSPSDAIAQGIVYVPEERGGQGTIAGLPIFQNMTLPSLDVTSRAGFLRRAREFALTRDYAGRLEVRAASLDQDIGTLSGGNQQKVVIGKWLATSPRIIILDEPTKGIDIGSKAAVHAIMSDLAAKGLSIIMVSSEIPEILGMSDRVVVMREGRIAGVFERNGLTAEALVRAAAGIREIRP